MAEFAFSAGQAAAIRAPLLGAGFAAEAVAEFVLAATGEVRDWQARSPSMDAEALRANKAALEALQAHLYGAQAALRQMTEAMKLPLWIALQDRADIAAQARLLNRDAPPPSPGDFPVCLLERREESTVESWRRVGDSMEMLLVDLRATVDRQLAAIGHHHGRTNARKIPLVEGLAWCYFETLRQAPTVTPGSPFMGVVAAIADAVGERIGKHAIAEAVGEWRANRENWLLRA